MIRQDYKYPLAAPQEHLTWGQRFVVAAAILGMILAVAIVSGGWGWVVMWLVG